MKFTHQIYVYGGNGLNAQFVTFVFNNNHCLDFLLLRRSGECSPQSLPVMQLGSSELLVFWTRAERQKRRVFQSLFPEMAQQAQLTGQYSCCHTLGSFGQPHRFSQVIMWCDGVSLHSAVPWVHSDLYHQLS